MTRSSLVPVLNILGGVVKAGTIMGQFSDIDLSVVRTINLELDK